MNILVADKDPKVLQLIESRLIARGYTVVSVSESEQAMLLLKNESFSLCILSTSMERVNGSLLIECIRKVSNLSSLPVIMMTEERNIADLVLSLHRGFDDFMIKPFSPLVLQLRVAINIERAKKRMEANALTQLPGNSSIARVIQEKIDQEKLFSVLYLDINDFKSFNDRYGFKKGDDVIRQTARILVQTGDKVVGSDDFFVGHVGGDDFIVVLDPQYEETFARVFLETFDRIMPTYYNEEDRKRKSICIENRKGIEEVFPLMSCSVAACTNLYRQYGNLGEIAQDAAELKKFLKSQPGSHYLRDRRSAPIENFEDAFSILKMDLAQPEKEGGEMEPLGRTLLNQGLINEDQLAVALEKNLETGKRLGQVLVSMKAVKSEELGKVLERKMGVPYVSLTHYLPSRELLKLFTVEFVKSKRAVPLDSTEEGLRIAMCDPFDVRTLDAIERITQLKTIPVLALDEEFDEFIAAHMKTSKPHSEDTGS